MTQLSTFPLREPSKLSVHRRLAIEQVTLKASRRGLQLLELVISLASASVLMTGMTSAVLIANRSAELARTRQATSTRNIAGLDRLRSDLSEGYPVTNRTAKHVTMSVSDRNGDGNRESIQYQWIGAGSPLQMSVNSGAWQATTEDLDAFNFSWRSCAPQSTQNGPLQLEPNPSLVFHSRTLATTTFGGAKTLTVDIPQTYQANDLLIAALSVSGNQGGSMVGPSGWTKVMEANNGGMVSLGVWIAFSNTLSQASFAWTSKRGAYATVAHFRVTGATAALTNFSSSTGFATLTPAPGSTANAANSLVVRVLAADGPLVGEEATNMPSHIAITMRRQLLENPIIGMAYRTYAAGAVPVANFGLPSNSDFVTATLVFQP